MSGNDLLILCVLIAGWASARILVTAALDVWRHPQDRHLQG